MQHATRSIAPALALVVGCFSEPPPVQGDSETDGDETSASPATTDGADVSAGAGEGALATASDASATDTSASTLGDGSDTGATTGTSTCGDGVLEQGEECDDGDERAGDGCHSDCTTYKQVFITSMRISGAFGGVKEGDGLCLNLAEASGLEGQFLAWLSDETSAVVDRFTPSSGAYRLLDGRLVAQNWADLIDGEIDTQIDMDEWGEHVGDGLNDYAWTGTDVMGQLQGPTCSDWALEGGTGRVGQLGWSVPSEWTSEEDLPCDRLVFLYCFEQ